jgi:hypothetical protein
LGLTLVLWDGEYRGIAGTWLRWATLDGDLLPTEAEAAHRLADRETARADEAERRAGEAEQRAEAERSRAEAERVRAERAEAELARLRKP